MVGRNPRAAEVTKVRIESMMIRLFSGAATAALLVAAGPAAAAVITIDTFDTPQTTFDRPAPSEGAPQGSEIAAAEAIGGYRDMYVETDAKGRLGATSLVAGSDPQSPADGILSFNNEDGVTGRGWVTYDGQDGGFLPNEVNINGLGGLDLWTGPIGGGFFFDVLRVDADLFAGITAYDTSGQTTSFGGTVVESGTPFAAFTDFDNPDFNWNSVGALQFFAQSGVNSDVISLDGAISSITVNTGVVPIPAAGFLLLAGIGGLSIAGRRRRKAA
ncbi:VPLPA-CTERM sorting domain-containing protein [Palleronia sp. LCG004]|uniref:VPLPA-CTERM sorting domain-containing protein n=1 Tax=Palleronia sp. LCG004 TaxID=3079304 RepID=UPI002943203E|nr:VPLPA-CTERM sorting domain-containing protein [Palleronia sp. LCG004]WOI58333.1 VPLPA-CTERM sorting domain-containing protein [Palleronia sp. LCG004]